MQKRGFYVDKDETQTRWVYRKLTLRNLYIRWNLRHVGIPEDLPDGFWIVTLERRRRVVLPGLVFREA